MKLWHIIHPNCLRCYINIREGSTYPGHKGYHGARPRRRVWRCDLVKRPSEKQLAAQRSKGVTDTSLVSKHPFIAAYLGDCLWDDGKPRETSTLTISATPGGMQVALNDRALGRSCYTTAGSVVEALELLETALKEDVAPWRPWKRSKG